MTVRFDALGLSAAEIAKLESFGLRYDKRQKREMMADASSGRTVGAADIVALEKAVGMKLPADYKAFLREHNGGKPSPSCLAVSASRTVSIQLFFAVQSAAANQTVAGVAAQFRDRVPADRVPIARDGAGNLLLIGVSGEVGFWDHELEADEDGAQPYYDNISPIAPSFSALLSMIHAE